MKQLLSLLLTLTLCSTTCQAQFGTFGKILKGAKVAIDAQKAAKKNQEEKGNQKVKDYDSPEHKKAMEEAQRQIDEAIENNAEIKRLREMQDDTVALKKYWEEKYGGMTDEEIVRDAYEKAGIDPNSKEVQEAQAKAMKMAGINNDPLFQKIMAEKRQLTQEEAAYFNEKYGTEFEYVGMEAYNDSVGVFAHLSDGMRRMHITKHERITDERPVPDFGQDEIKQYVKEHISILKNPLADRVIVDSVQNYMIYNHRHADEQFKRVANFTIYSNSQRSSESVDPKNILVFKVHKGIGCRYMEYMYSKISYKQSELNDYISNRLVDEGYIDANINQKLSDDQMFRAMDKMEFQFKVEKLLQLRQNNDKYVYANTIQPAENVRITSNSRKVAVYVTALDISIAAEPGEYAFIIRNPDVEEFYNHLADDVEDEKERKFLQNVEISTLTQGAFFFTIK